MSDDDEVDLNLSIPDEFHKDFRWTTGRREFCYHMARMGDTKKAAEAAGMSPTSGPYLFQLEAVRDVVQLELARLLRVAGENEECVIARWSRWADVDIGDFFAIPEAPNGDPNQVIDHFEIKPFSQLTKEQRQCIKKIKVTRGANGRNIEFEVHDAHKANNDLAQMMGLLGRGDTDATPPEELAASIQRTLQEMQNVNGLQQPEGDSEEAADTSRVIN